MVCAGVAEKNALKADYREHVRSFLPKLRSYKFFAGAEYLEKWIQDELTPAPLLDLTGCLSL